MAKCFHVFWCGTLCCLKMCISIYMHIYLVYTAPWIMLLERADWLARRWLYMHIHLRASSDARNSEIDHFQCMVTDKVVFGAIFCNLCSIRPFQKQDKYRRKRELLRDLHHVTQCSQWNHARIDGWDLSMYLSINLSIYGSISLLRSRC